MNFAWFRWVLFIILGTFLLEAAAQLLNISYEIPNSLLIWNSLLRALIIWSLALWGLTQTPNLSIELAKSSNNNSDSKKYRKSGLTESQLKEVAIKIRNTLENNSLYRDPDLSLRTLSNHINVLPNYASQALNTEINETFFDYVNRLRVEDAMRQLVSSNETVLTISSEVGFNSRSSFYTAFKKVTGKTPSEYRRGHLNG